MALNFRPHHLSHSQLALYENCPRCYYLQYGMGCYPVDTPEVFTFGKIFHESVAAYFRGNDVWRGFQIGLAKEKISNPQQIARYRKSIELMWGYYQTFGTKYVADKIEHPFETVIQNPVTREVLPIPFRGVFDLITKEGDIVDHKTSSSEYGEEKMDDPQLMIYSMAYRKMYGKAPRSLRFSIFRKDDKLGRWQEMVIPPDEMNEAILFLKIKRTVKLMEMGEFEPKPDAPFYHIHNQMCPYYRRKRSWNKQVKR